MGRQHLLASAVSQEWPCVGRRSACDPAVAAVLCRHGVDAGAAEFGLHHEIGVPAPPDRVWDVLGAVTLGELPMTRWLSAVRHLGRHGGTSAPLVSSGPFPLVHLAPPDLMIAAGTSRPWQLRPSRWEPSSLQRWVEFHEMGWVKIVLAFTILDGGGGASRLRSDTLVWPTSRGARARFTPYWRGVEPFAALIRREILAAVARQAGAASGESSRRPV